MEKLVKILFGSHLYGTSNENSDKDYKGIFMPTKRDIFLLRVPKCHNFNTKPTGVEGLKNSSEDVDEEYYSLHYFLELAKVGETVALDMLHAPKQNVIETSEVWKDLVNERKRFYTNDLKSFVGYARKQASKYGIKGSRLNDAKRVMDFFLAQGKLDKDNKVIKPKLKEIWNRLPIGEHIIKHKDPDKNGVRMYEVCNRKFPETCDVEYAFYSVQKFYVAYGARAQQAAENKGVDWKAISHAFRAAIQVKEILTKGTIEFPLREAPFLLKLKQAEFHYQNDGIGRRLDDLMDELEELSAKSTLPSKVDSEYWDDWLVDTIGE